MKPTKIIRCGGRWPRITCALRILFLGRPTVYRVTFGMRQAVNELFQDADIRTAWCTYRWLDREVVAPSDGTFTPHKAADIAALRLAIPELRPLSRRAIAGLYSEFCGTEYAAQWLVLDAGLEEFRRWMLARGGDSGA